MIDGAAVSSGHDAASRQRTQVSRRSVDPDLHAQSHVAQRLSLRISRRQGNHALRRTVLRQDIRRNGDGHGGRKLRRSGQIRCLLFVHRAGCRQSHQHDRQSTRDESMRHICRPECSRSASGRLLARIPEIGKVDRNARRRGHFVTRLIRAVERDLGNRREHDAVESQRSQRRLHL